MHLAPDELPGQSFMQKTFANWAEIGLAQSLRGGAFNVGGSFADGEGAGIDSAIWAGCGRPNVSWTTWFGAGGGTGEFHAGPQYTGVTAIRGNSRSTTCGAPRPAQGSSSK